MDKGKFYESMVKLYLRLNGYFQTGLISHSMDWGNNFTEMDSIAVRFPLHKQPERLVGFCPVLNPSKLEIEVVIAEVKSNSVKFNKSLKNADKNVDRNWEQILNWIGMFEANEIKRLIPLLKNDADSDQSNLAGIEAFTPTSKTIIRPIIFSFELSNSTTTPKKYLSGNEVIDYIWHCLCPDIRRQDCSTVYPLGNWGGEFEFIAQYFKDRNNNNQGKPSIEDLKTDFKLS